MARIREPTTVMDLPFLLYGRTAHSQDAADAGEGLSGGPPGVRVGQPFGERARLVGGHVHRALPGTDVTDHLPGVYLGAFGQVGGGDGAGGVGDDDAELRRRLE